MEDNKSLGNNNRKPIENHETAAWADIEKTTPESKVGIPREQAVDSARKWVNTNEK